MFDAPFPPPPTPTRQAGLAQLEAFLPKAGKVYASERNTDTGPDQHDSVSHLSPYLRHRLVCETEVLERTLARFSISTAEKFVQEVVWRAYFKGWLEQRPGIWADYRGEVQADLERLESDRAMAERYAQAVAGRTGIDCFDFWAEELPATGYLHNHARMWAASIWIFTLQLPWALGADWFLRHLADGDAAANTLSWRWVAGLHTKGKTYLARPDNIAKFTNGRFRPTPGQLANDAPALEAGPLPSPVMPAAPEALPDTGPVGLLITDDDCHPESLPIGAEVAAVAGTAATADRSPLAVGRAVQEFTDGAIDDALSRAGRHYQAPATRLDAGDSAEALIAWARSAGIDRIVTAYLPQGPMRDRVDAVRPALRDAGIALYEIRRAYDAAFWPYATAGFFKVKKQIPRLLTDLGLA